LNALVVPSQAIQAGQQGQYVFVIKPDSTVESRPVKVAFALGPATVVRQGVQAGERVVTDGQLRLVSGARVDVKPSGPAPASPPVPTPAPTSPAAAPTSPAAAPR